MVFYTVTIDTEEEWDWNGPFPVTDLSTENIRHLPEFQAICDENEARPTYFVNHAVLSDQEACQSVLRLNEADSVEIGMHIHPWNTPPTSGGVVAARETFIHNLPDDLARQKLEVTYGKFRESGIAPTSFRGGRYSSGPVVREFLVENNFRVDASICPYSSWSDEGAPDYRLKGMTPVLRTTNQAGLDLWEVPLSRAYSRRPFRMWEKFFHTVENSLLRHLRLIGIAERCGLVRRLWLNFESEPLDNLRQFIRLAPRWGLSHICMTVHSSSLTPGPGPYCRSEKDKETILRNIDTILAELKQTSGYQPVTMTELAAKLDEAKRREC